MDNLPQHARLLVYSGRDFADQHWLIRVLDKLAKLLVIDCVIEGDARGADRMAGYWARKHGISNIKFKADWGRYKKGAGSIRNAQMLLEGKPDLVLAFPGGKGTQNMLDQANGASIPILYAEDIAPK